MYTLVDDTASTFTTVFSPPWRFAVVFASSVPSNKDHAADYLSVFSAFQYFLCLNGSLGCRDPAAQCDDVGVVDDLGSLAGED